MAEVTVAGPIAIEGSVPAPRRLSGRMLFALTHLSFAHQFLWTGMLLLIIPAQVVAIAGDKNKNTALAGVLVAGAFMATVTQVLAGALSDRATFRLGRRRPFILGGTALALVGLYLMSTAHSIAALAAFFLVLQCGFNIGQAAYSAVIPDWAPPEQRGLASGLQGLMAMLGTIASAVVVSIMIKNPDFPAFRRTYLVIMAILALLTVTTALLLREEPLHKGEPLALGGFLRDLGRSLWDLRTQHDFAWVVVTRFLIFMGYFTVLDFLYNYVRDELGPQNVAHAVLLITGAVIIAAALTIFFAGYISDRVGRKPVVYVSAGLMAVVSLTWIGTHSVGMAMAVGAIWGLGWGAFQSVDYALATDVLPRPQRAGQATNFARYMGIWSLAINLPQVLSPSIGPLIDVVNNHRHGGGYTLMFVAVCVYFSLGAILIRNVRRAR